MKRQVAVEEFYRQRDQFREVCEAQELQPRRRHVTRIELRNFATLVSAATSKDELTVGIKCHPNAAILAMNWLDQTSLDSALSGNAKIIINPDYRFLLIGNMLSGTIR